MNKLCVIGHPVSHSKSPTIHNTMIGALGLDFEYSTHPVTPEQLPQFMRQLRDGLYQGCNVTMPHKKAVIPYLDVVTEDGLACDAVNTICNKNGKLYGYNTDGGGFLLALAQNGIAYRGKNVMLLGAGGAARAVTCKLADSGVNRITVCNRTVEKGAILATARPDIVSATDSQPETLLAIASESDLLINCTNLGMDGSPPFPSLDFLEGLPQHCAVCDLIYHPAQTELLQRAAAQGHLTMNGLPMLVGQAVLALEHFAETAIDMEAMLPLVQQALAQ